MNRIRAIDTMKGLCIFAIVLYHIQLNMDYKIIQFCNVNGGIFGNTIFFMISGLLLTEAYYDRIVMGEISLGEFMKRRLCKLYPMYLVSSIAVVFFMIYSGRISELTFKAVFLNIFLITTGWIENGIPFNIPCWFLSVLILLSIIWYVLVRKLKENSIYGFVFMIFAGLFITKMWCNIPFLYYQDGEGMIPFFVGCLLHWIKESKYLKKYTLMMVFVAVAYLIMTFKLGFEAASGGDRYIWIFLICPLLVMICICPSIVKTVLESNVLYGTFGDISMIVFFWHIPLKMLFDTIVLSRYDISPSMIGLGYLVSLFIFAKGYIIVKNKPNKTRTHEQ